MHERARARAYQQDSMRMYTRIRVISASAYYVGYKNDVTRSTKDRKKGCAYDPGALNKQGALKNQTLRYARACMI